MKRILFLFLATATATATVFAQDTVVFKNGDVLTGRVLKQDRTGISFQSQSFGTVSLKAEDIEEIRLEAQETETTKAKTPPPAAAAPPQIAKKAPSAPPPVAPPPPPKKKKRWTGQAGLEVAMREKNTTRLSNNNIINRTESYETYRVYGHVNWKGEKNNLNWKWAYRFSQDETRVRDDFLNLTQKYNHTFEENNYYAEAKTIYQRDYNRKIENEYLQTAELGRKWFDRPRFSFSTSLGAGYHQFDRLIAGKQVSTQEPRLIIDQAVRWQLINSLTLFQKYTHLGDWEKYHLVFTAGLENKLIRDVFLRVEYRLDRDTETRYDDKGFYDKALRTSLLYKF